MSALPLVCKWDGESFTPVGRYAKEADAAFVIGRNYRMAEVQERSTAAHNRYFAALHEAWTNFPDALLDDYPSAEHLRKHALIRCGYCDSLEIILATAQEALRQLATFKARDTYSIVTVRGQRLTILTAKSQSIPAMGAKAFYKSVDDVDGFVAGLIGVSVDDLRQNAGKAA